MHSALQLYMVEDGRGYQAFNLDDENFMITKDTLVDKSLQTSFKLALVEGFIFQHFKNAQYSTKTKVLHCMRSVSFTTDCETAFIYSSITDDTTGR